MVAMFLRRLINVATIGLLICLAGPGVSHGRLLHDVDRARRIAKAPSFRIGSVVKDPKTLTIQDLGELFRRTTGNVRPQSVLRHGDFASYWKASYSGRSGKAFEAFETYRANRRLARMGKGERLLVTAVEGAPGDPADIVMRNSRGKVIKEFQLKAGARGAIKALDDSRYTGMTIVTHRDSLDRIRLDLAKAKSKAARRGRPLHSKWQRIDRALREGLLADEMVPGLRTRSREQIRRVTEKYTRRMYETVSTSMSRYAPRTSKLIASSAISAGKGARLASTTLKTVGKVFVVTDFAFIGYQTYSDAQRYRSGELGGGLLAGKSVLRGGELGVVVTLLLVPEPTTKVIAVCIVAGVLIAGTDASLDVFADAKRERTRRLLEGIDRDERFHAARRQLLREVEDL